ncbi:hypothetical protein V3C99_005811, partial [Haemonchus contortus]|uniref:Pilus assembly protein PilM n=1 Tax=Haemonchus contortus TaxID=6289 RepID=A0A7I4XU92_HAECO
GTVNLISRTSESSAIDIVRCVMPSASIQAREISWGVSILCSSIEY